MVMIKLNFAKFKPNFSEKDKFASIYIWIFYLFIAHFSYRRAKRICAKTGHQKRKYLYHLPYLRYQRRCLDLCRGFWAWQPRAKLLHHQANRPIWRLFIFAILRAKELSLVLFQGPQHEYQQRLCQIKFKEKHHFNARFYLAKSSRLS